MEIQKILRYRFYLVLALIYVISVTALCFRAPVVQRPVELTSADVETEPNQSADPYAGIATPIDQSRTQSATMRPPTLGAWITTLAQRVAIRRRAR